MEYAIIGWTCISLGILGIAAMFFMNPAIERKECE